jgi:hypothetical protein
MIPVNLRKGKPRREEKYRKNWLKIAQNRGNLNIYTIQKRYSYHRSLVRKYH